MPDTHVAQFVRWSDIPKEHVTDAIARQLVTGAKVMVAHMHLKKGAIVPRHAHDNEQIACVLEGVVRLWVGADDEQMFDVHAGEVLVLPSGVPHRAEALADTLVADVFSPPRQDWLDGTDTYFRQK